MWISQEFQWKKIETFSNNWYSQNMPVKFFVRVDGWRFTSRPNVWKQLFKSQPKLLAFLMTISCLGYKTSISKNIHNIHHLIRSRIYEYNGYIKFFKDTNKDQKAYLLDFWHLMYQSIEIKASIRTMVLGQPDILVCTLRWGLLYL